MSEGTVFQRSDGRWCAKYKDIRGKWKYLYRKSKGEAKRALRQALKDRDEGIVPPSKMTVGALLDEWIEDMREDVSHRTWLNREGFVRLHIKPAIANTTLANLTADARMLCRQKTRQGLASSSVRRIHELLYQALRYGVSSKYISRSPLDNVTPPKATYREIHVLKAEQVRRLLDTVRGNRWECVIVLGAVCALRIEEALRLRHEDVNLMEGTISIRRTLWKYGVYPPKTPSSRRTLKLPQIALEALTRLCEAQGNPSEGWLVPNSKRQPYTLRELLALGMETSTTQGWFAGVNHVPSVEARSSKYHAQPERASISREQVPRTR